ncbi:aspartate kinase [Nonomuraea typhae]|uniref:aspartate kinase n=1 Tax=Nonomuraea typhae TaxID=2603600 RepID=UPI0012F9AC96|nr:aspartate kinase [Nonomuraea typhae]
MKILVQKYGGSSLATAEQLRAMAERVAMSHRVERPVVVVVSARGSSTDALLGLGGSLNERASAREIDQLVSTGETSSAAQMAMVLDGIGLPATSLTGWQAGIRVSGPYGEGRIAGIDTGRIRTLLRRGFVPVVSGFQGVDQDGDVITLGRGGSDTTAVALAAELRAERCEIYTDVDGVFTADPRVVRKARMLPRVHFHIIAEMTRSGARVLHPRSVDLAFSRNIEVHVRNASTGEPGSVLVKKGHDSVEDMGAVVAVTHDADTAEISISFDPVEQASLPEILDTLGKVGVEMDLFTYLAEKDRHLVRFTVSRSRVDDVRATLGVTGLASADTLKIDETLGKVSLVGSGPAAHPAHPARMLRALAEAGIPSTSVHAAQARASVLVPSSRLAESVNALHGAFQLGQDDYVYSLEREH